MSDSGDRWEPFDRVTQKTSKHFIENLLFDIESVPASVYIGIHRGINIGIYRNGPEVTP
jgi:hypothetical protein